MNHPVYILSASAISPQHSFCADSFLPDLQSSDDGKLFAVDGDYKQYISPVAIRRMSRMLKMSISAGMQSLRDAGVACPDAIITGTGRGSMADMEHFLTDMIQLNEEALNPTFFIQSTYNSPNGWLAMQTKSNGYNQTYVHRGSSLELALLDTQMLLQETTEKKNVLVGCFDEITHDYFVVKDKVGYWKQQLPNSLNLLQHNNTNGSIAGEGAAFFTISNQQENAVCKLLSLEIMENPTEYELQERLQSCLSANGVSFDDIDIVIAGLNGDARQQYIYNTILPNFQEQTHILAFKHLVGEYDTSGGFALWLSSQLFETNAIPDVLSYKKGMSQRFRNVLIVNHYLLGNVSFQLLSAC
jgi:3-oxoacyl-[acyl-carrier-protein] synthase II